MIFEKKVPEWPNAGTEPSESLKESGFVGGYKPPASVFNWFWHGMSEVAKELHGAGLFAHLGDNPINQDGDTVDAWAALGSGYARYTDAGTLKDKPSKYGVLLNFCVNGKDMFQLWYATTTGPMYHRSGNANGWNGTWKKVYDTANNPAITDILTSQLSVELGGTGATTKKDAFKNLAFLGQNPIASIEDDTIENWVALGSGFAWISELDRLNKQPSNYGLLINYVPNSYEVTQIWKTHSSGPMFIRSGNRNGWGQQWTKVYDTANKPTPAEIGAIPVINAESASYDMDIIAASGDHEALYITNANTLGTPYKKGVSTYTEALILSYGSSANYAMQVAFISGGQPFVRYLHNGELSEWFNVLTSAQLITLEQGGTNANNRADAMYNLAFIGENPITATSEDTAENWVKLGTGYAWFIGYNQLLNQPSQYGMLLNLVNGVEVTQIWKSHANGAIWTRSGNKAGWGQVWARLYDTLNPPTADNITGILPLISGGTGANSAAGALTNLHAFRNLGKEIVKSVADDTVANWATIDSGYSYYENKGLLNDQPSQYGILISFRQSTEVFQLWRTQSGGPTYWRSGNSAGWASTWAKVYDIQNKPTPNEIGAAPGGYGLGESDVKLKSLEELNAYTGNGWFRLDAQEGITFGGRNATAWYGQTRRYNNNYLEQEMSILSHSSPKLIRRCINGTWVDEWENPPMVPGVEYRTTERSNNDAVYVKRVAYNNEAEMGSDTAVTSVTIPHGITEFKNLDRVVARNTSAKYVLPYLNTKGGMTVVTGVNSTHITMRISNTAWASGYNWEFDVYYTKG